MVKYWSWGCGLSIFEGIKGLTRHGPELSDLAGPPWSRMTPRGPFRCKLFCDSVKLSFLGSKSWCFQMFFTIKTRCKKDPYQRYNLPRLIKKCHVIFVNSVYSLCCGCNIRKAIHLTCVSCRTLLSWALDSVCFTSALLSALNLQQH